MKHTPGRQRVYRIVWAVLTQVVEVRSLFDLPSLDGEPTERSTVAHLWPSVPLVTMTHRMTHAMGHQLDLAARSVFTSLRRFWVTPESFRAAGG